MTITYVACAVLGYLLGEWSRWERSVPVQFVPQTRSSDVVALKARIETFDPYYNEVVVDSTWGGLSHGLQFSAHQQQIDSQLLARAMQNDFEAYLRGAEGLRNMTPEERQAHEAAMGAQGTS